MKTGGLHVMTAAEYHADPCPSPSLSSTLARVLLAQSSAHAWWAHPRLNPDFTPDEDEKYDVGTAAHALLLEGGGAFEIVPAASWRTRDAKEHRAAALAAGKRPLLAHQWANVQEMVVAARHQLAAHEAPIPFTGGKPEQTLVWREDDVWCRARLDWLHDGERRIDDYKTTTGTANPEAWSRTLFGAGYDVQAAFYLRGVRALFEVEATFRFVVQETAPPYALSVVSLMPEALDCAHRKVEYAIKVWRECMTTGQWPAYPTRTCYAEAPPWEIARWTEREARDWTPPPPAIADDGRPIGELLMGETQ